MRDDLFLELVESVEAAGAYLRGEPADVTIHSIDPEPTAREESVSDKKPAP